MTIHSVTAQDEQSLTLSWINVTFFGIIHALSLLAPWFFSWSALGTMLFLHWLLGSIGICLGYHRLLTHRSLQVPKWLEYGLAILGAIALQGGPIFWVATHRLHHAYTEDKDKDPYSAQRGFCWSHMLWILYPRPEFFNYDTYKKYAPELARDPFYRWLDQYFLFLQIPVAILLFALGGWSFVVYGVFLRAVLLWHSTWLINSAAHWRGYSNFELNDSSRNLWWAALLTYGEGWHNNHHAHPNVAKAGLRWWEIDMTWWAIKTLQTLGLAKKVVES
ncbi:fatty acid desaturase [Aetokthonos hydrillicola Thurmond2011]|jgi:stearoyl-CoA desaturase (delta-9 desaturase)|uniref:Fatty acid desaturase n=1 Tax=Aetokthonos hydrillicola Thurmond2011 TaxID=2712845 RepID=A0AAP5I6E4_9CYAN|nr:fatty acid desaturase [Aetokthonos hydrillicola]MBO3463470.1 acyl-CoA desaturase [Aetokthonos hydrillicola CCALA 1050]MBW4583731.1 fatty acid desaturase [Aetokthonos hydrillicola CCALA 1050]MDR9895574.1 fatty acid desaturase [Aetokthonos hydrillicola Thurmond2011]